MINRLKYFNKFNYFFDSLLMKLNLVLKILTVINFLNVSYSYAHKLPSHFADHKHQSDPKFEKPYIRVKK